MPAITPLGFIFIPLLILASRQKDYSLMFFFASLPFYGLHVFRLVGHAFTFPELALMAFGVNQIQRWYRSREIKIPATIPLYALFGFWITCLLSVLYLVLNTPSITVHPYNTGSLDELVLRDLSFTLNNISQLILRTFFVWAVIVLTINIDREGINNAIKAVIFGGCVILSVGIVYQVTQFFNFYAFAQFLEWLGFRIQTRAGGFLGLIPRMWTTAGEPGFAAHYLLFALSLTAPFAVVSEQSTSIFTKFGGRVFSSIFLAGIILSTSTTGIGGLLIFFFVLGIVSLLSPSLDHERIGRLYAIGLAFGTIVVLVGALLSTGILNILFYTISKLQFNAGSGTLRMTYIQMAIEIVTKRPFLGIGVGSQYGASLLGTLTAETGLTGLLLFLSAYISSIVGCLRIARRNRQESIIATAVVVSSATLLGTSLLAKSVTVLLFPWTWLSLALPIAVVIQYSSHQLLSIASQEIHIKPIRSRL
ncbi:O-antigen ligase family protein [Haladaptatus pallidirubidus]|uniref:O-antigen ligase family protein n=1 Tax=Haladaptatus pallidirubidus TaxID=1008152 RepID=UPI001D121EEE|nr:O-antigen ligase family protein [Haladaptatus pallidirubidus]